MNTAFARRSGTEPPGERSIGVNQNKRIVAFGLLTQSDLKLLGPTFDRAWPVDDDPCFEELLKALDEVDVRREGQQPQS